MSKILGTRDMNGVLIWCSPMNNRTPIAKTDELDILSGIWILSCNDDNPIMTYRGVSQRLNLPETFDVRAVVRSRPELFRPGILNSRLNAWKDRMRSGKNRPNWILEIHDGGEQEKTIDQLSRNDVFRNQFRVEDGAEKCDIKIIDWGLQHIDRLRRAAAEEKEAKSRKWTSIIILLASLIVAVVSVAGSVGVQWLSIHEQTVTKHYEVDLKPKQEAYSSFMLASALIMGPIGARDRDNFKVQIAHMESAYFSLEPFLKEQKRSAIRAEYLEFVELCHDQMNRPADQSAADEEAFFSKAASSRFSLRDQRYSNLFESN